MKVLDTLEAFVWRDYRENNCNTYLIRGEKTLLIDPGHRHLFYAVKAELNALGIGLEQVDMVLITHGHPDHFEAANEFSAPTLRAFSRKDYDALQKYARGTFSIPAADLLLRDGSLTVGDVTFSVLETPGHSPGSLCFYWEEKKALFTGDVVFSRGIGRTDLPGGNPSLLKQSIKNIFSLDVEILLCGHGEIVSGRQAVQANFKEIEKTWFRYL